MMWPECTTQPRCRWQWRPRSYMGAPLAGDCSTNRVQTVPACPQVDRRSSASVYEKPPDCRRRCSIRGQRFAMLWRGTLSYAASSGRRRFRQCFTSVTFSRSRWNGRQSRSSEEMISFNKITLKRWVVTVNRWKRNLPSGSSPETEGRIFIAKITDKNVAKLVHGIQMFEGQRLKMCDCSRLAYLADLLRTANSAAACNIVINHVRTRQHNYITFN